MELKEIKKEPKWLRSEVVETWEDPSDKPVYFEAPKSGSDSAKHKWQARYRYTKTREFFDDGSTKDRIKNELLPGTLLDLSAVEGGQQIQNDREGNPRKAKIIEFPKAS